MVHSVDAPPAVPASGYVPPRGPRGLWAALAEATAGAVAVDLLDEEPVADVVDVPERAHLGYLARLAGSPAPADRVAGGDCQVIDLAAFRATHR